MAYAAYRGLTNALWVLARPWFAWKRSRGGAEWSERLGELPRLEGRPVWVHAASVGEVNAAGPVVRELSSRGLRVLLTTMTPTGQRTAAGALGAEARTAFVPLDFTAAVGTALERVRPRSLVLVESELWPNLLLGAMAAGVPAALVNGRLSKRTLGRAAGPLSPVREAALTLRVAACRDEENAARFLELGLPRERVVVTGDTKFDALGGPLAPAERESLRVSLGVEAAGRAVVFGSVRPREESAVVRAAAELAPLARPVVAPRHMRRAAHIERALTRSGVRVFSRSSGDATRGPGAVLVDTTGELARLYGAGDAAFVGGTLGGYGGHNPLEPASRGVPVVLGPDTRNCEQVARALVDGGGVVRITDGRELPEVLARLLTDDELRTETARAALRVVEAGRGAASRSVAALERAGLLEVPR